MRHGALPEHQRVKGQEDRQDSPVEGTIREKKKIFKVKHFSGQRRRKRHFFTSINVSFRKAQSQPMTLLEQRNGMIDEGDFTREKVK